MIDIKKPNLIHYFINIKLMKDMSKLFRREKKEKVRIILLIKEKLHLKVEK